MEFKALSVNLDAFEAEDFGSALAPEFKEQAERLYEITTQLSNTNKQ